MTRALVLVDIQNDFCEGGSLGVSGGTALAAAVASYVLAHHGDYDAIVATQDWHIDPGTHFSDTPDFVDSWPVHCVAGTHGSELRPELEPALPYLAASFRKGEYEAAYSGFEGHYSTVGAGATDAAGPLLGDWLRAQGVEALDVVGIATDHCVRATVLDGVTQGFSVRVLTDLVAGVDATAAAAALTEMQAAGAGLVESTDAG